MLPDFGAIFLRKDRIVKANSVGGRKMERRGIELVKGEARFLSNNEIQVDDERLTAGRFVIATGARPLIPGIDGLADCGCWTSREAVNPDRQPESLAIIGGSAVGCEFAQIYSRLGTRVTIFEAAPVLLNREDAEITSGLAEILESEGIELNLGAAVKGVSMDGENKVVHYEDGGRLVADEVLVAAGRVPAVDGIDIEAAGVAVETGAIAVDAFLRTGVSNIWACGDAIGSPMFSHVATYEGTVAGRNSADGEEGTAVEVNHRIVPGAVFTDPPLASVGITEDQAIARGLDVSVGRAYFRDTGRADAMGETQGMVKLVAGADGELLGAHILGPGADMIIHEAVIVMGSRLGVDALLRPRALHVHPTLSETLARAAAAAR